MIPTLPIIDKASFQKTTKDEKNGVSFPVSPITEVSEIRAELILWLTAIESFSHVENLPLADSNTKNVLAHDWRHEVRVVRWALLRSAHLATRLITEAASNEESSNFTALFSALSDTVEIADCITNAQTLDFYGWTAWNQTLERSLHNLVAYKTLVEKKPAENTINLPPKLENFKQHPGLQQAVGREILGVFSRFTDLLGRLRLIGNLLERDEPLKPSLLIFALVHQETKSLINFIQNRVLRFLKPEHAIFDVLDGTIYIISMELRKVFTRELVGVSDLRPAPAIYARVETSHGLLQDCFQQSIIVLAQFFEPELQGADVFPNFRTRLEESLVLRADLWQLLQTVKKSENAPETYPLARLHERIKNFRENSMRFLMFKDCDETERFFEEVLLTRNPQELVPLLHRFNAYLETLLGQVNMRTVLSDHPFEYPPLRD